MGILWNCELRHSLFFDIYAASSSGEWALVAPILSSFVKSPIVTYSGLIPETTVSVVHTNAHRFSWLNRASVDRCRLDYLS